MNRIIFIILWFIPFLSNAQLQINEIMPKNVSFIMDDAYNFSMWAEVYNSSNTGKYISNYYFTDNLNNPKKWRPLKAIIESKGYYLLYFEREDREGHASFKLEPEGGNLYLLDSSLNIIDYISYPAQYRNISYGRQTETSNTWVFFERPTPGKSNKNALYANQQCSNPIFSLKNGFYNSSIDVTFITPPDNEIICYTTDNTEPTKNSKKYVNGTKISVDTTTVFRAKAYKTGKLSSDVVTSTYFINERKSNLRVVSISTDQKYLTNDTIGIYCNGTNGITGNLQDTPKNFNQDWDRPVNFEFFDTSGEPCLNQEVDIRIVGGGSRESLLKSISISPKKKFGDNQLRYDFFAATKPGNKYRQIMLRNGGNDFKRTMMKDAFLQSIIINRMDIDYQAYEPAVIFINGKYCGIENLRERSNKDFVYSNYGLDDDEVTLIEATYKGVDSHNDMATDPEFAEISKFLKRNSMTIDSNYAKACQLFDVDEFINYQIFEIYVSNVDWPYNNVKMWKKTDGGKWRWILMDVEYSYSSGRINHNSISFAEGKNPKSVIGGYDFPPEWSTVVFAELIKNETFRNKFIDRFCIHLSTTFQPNRVIYIMDSIAAKIKNEIPYHLSRYNIVNNFQNDLNSFKYFAKARHTAMLNIINSYFLNSAEIQTIKLNANIPGATYRLNSEFIMDSSVTISYYNNRNIALEANPIPGYRFNHWIINNEIYYEKIYTDTMNGNIELTAIYKPGFDTIMPNTVFINEVVTSNQNVPDEFGENDDYIEIYNNGETSVNMAGWYITDNTLNKTLFKIPSTDLNKTLIPPKTWKVLWADDDPGQGVLHLGFKLSKTGGTIVLSAKTDSIKIKTIDSVYVPEIVENFSLSRFPDGSSTWAIQQPTCKSTNIIYSVPIKVPIMIAIDPEPFYPDPALISYKYKSNSSGIYVYPTVVANYFNLMNATGETCTIIDLTGKIKYKALCQSNNEIINISNFHKGFYIVWVNDKMIKIIKN